MISEYQQYQQNEKLHIYGSDNIGANIDLAKRNARQILLHTHIQFTKKEFSDFKPSIPSGTIIMNPPYGERLGDENELELLYQLIGSVLKENCADSDAFIFSGNRVLTKMIGLKSRRSHILNNGKIECRLLHYPIRKGNYVD